MVQATTAPPRIAPAPEAMDQATSATQGAPAAVPLPRQSPLIGLTSTWAVVPGWATGAPPTGGPEAPPPTLMVTDQHDRVDGAGRGGRLAPRPDDGL